MNFPRREEATNKELVLTIIEIQGFLSRYGKSHTNWHETLNEVIERLEQAESEAKDEQNLTLKQESVLDNIRADIEQKLEQERFARSVFRHEEKDAVKAEQCTGGIFAYNNVIRLIDEYKAESGEV